MVDCGRDNLIRFSEKVEKLAGEGYTAFHNYIPK